MKKNNAFENLEIATNFNIDIATLDAKFKKMMASYIDNELATLNITQSYSILKSDISRGEEILAIFQIPLESIEISSNFLEVLMAMEGAELQELSSEIHKNLIKFEISNESILEFAKKLVMYKYVNKALLQNT